MEQATGLGVVQDPGIALVIEENEDIEIGDDLEVEIGNQAENSELGHQAFLIYSLFKF